MLRTEAVSTPPRAQERDGDTPRLTPSWGPSTDRPRAHGRWRNEGTRWQLPRRSAMHRAGSTSTRIAGTSPTRFRKSSAARKPPHGRHQDFWNLIWGARTKLAQVTWVKAHLAKEQAQAKGIDRRAWDFNRLADQHPLGTSPHGGPKSLDPLRVPDLAGQRMAATPHQGVH